MIKRNDGKGVNAIQNKFTAFLTVADRNRRKHYIENMHKSNAVISRTDLLESTFGKKEDGIEAIIIQDTLKTAVKQLVEREKKIFVLHVIEDKSFVEISQIMGMTYKNTASVFYRSMAKLRDVIRGMDDEF